MQDRLVVHVKHVSADDGRFAAEIGECHCAHHALCLKFNVVIEQHDVVALV